MDSFSFSEKILYHPRNVADYVEEKRPFPMLLEVDLTDVCNHRCKFCYTEEREKKNMATLNGHILLKALLRAQKHGCKAVSLTGGGEPLIHKDFTEIARAIKRMGLDLGLMTNGSLMDSTMWDEVKDNFTGGRVSITAGTPEQYIQTHGVNSFDTVINNVRYMAQNKGKTAVGVRMLVTQESVSTVVDIIDVLKDIPVDYLQFAPDMFSKDAEFWNKFKSVMQDEKTPWKVLFSGFNVNEDLTGCTACHAHSFQACIKADGSLMFCKNARQSSYILGNINKDDILNIWNSDRTLELEARLRPDNCGLFCKNMSLNRTIENIKHPPEDIQINFVN